MGDGVSESDKPLDRIIQHNIHVELSLPER